MKMKVFGPPGGGGASLAPSLDPPMATIAIVWMIEPIISVNVPT